MEDLSIPLLVAGSLRCAAWGFAIYLGWRSRRLLVIAGFLAAFLPAVIFAWSNAGGTTPQCMFDAATVLATPAAVLIAGALWYTTRRHPEDGARWTL